MQDPNISKNIVIFADGTWNRRNVGAQTNVSKLYDLTASRRNQVKFYDPGVGAHSLRFTGGIGGVGISRNIQECYRFIIAHYEPGDRIFLFGFSRGAFTVRSLSALLSAVGVIDKRVASIPLVKEAYEAYRKIATYPYQAEQFRKNYCYPKETLAAAHDGYGPAPHVPFFLGVWDTVGSLGIPGFLNHLNPFPHAFHNLSLPTVNYLLEKSTTDDPATEFHAYHAIAIDEVRTKFAPTLWTDAKGSPLKKGALPSHHTVRQTWFPGVHSDIGGGYLESSLSDFSLLWMMRKAAMRQRDDGSEQSGKGLHFIENAEHHLHASHTGLLHDSHGGFPWSLFPPVRRQVMADSINHIHGSVFARMKELPDYRPSIPLLISGGASHNDLNKQLDCILSANQSSAPNIHHDYSLKEIKKKLASQAAD